MPCSLAHLYPLRGRVTLKIRDVVSSGVVGKPLPPKGEGRHSCYRTPAVSRAPGGTYAAFAAFAFSRTLRPSSCVISLIVRRLRNDPELPTATESAAAVTSSAASTIAR